MAQWQGSRVVLQCEVLATSEENAKAGCMIGGERNRN